MENIKKKYFVFLILVSFLGNGQMNKTTVSTNEVKRTLEFEKLPISDKKLNKINKKFEDFRFHEAICEYEKAVRNKKHSEEIVKKTGDAYYIISDYRNAAFWYTKIPNISLEVNKEYAFRYMNCMRALGMNNNANSVMNELMEADFYDSRILLLKNNKTDFLVNNKFSYKVTALEINSAYTDYAPAIYGNQLVFTSGRRNTSEIQWKNNWSGQYLTDLYAVELDDLISGNPKTFSKFPHTKLNESTAVFTKDGKTMYFAHSNSVNGKLVKNAVGETVIKIYRASLINGKWGDVIDLPFNGNDFMTAHPALSPDEKTLYFVSNRPGTLGQSDIYKVSILEDGNFGNPENLGSTINTEGKELFPFVSGDNELYFASDGRPGFGGLDIFLSKIREDGSCVEPENMGSEINSPQNDFSFVMDNKMNIGFFASNRPGGKGNDDIYSFTINKKETSIFNLDGIKDSVGKCPEVKGLVLNK